MKLALLAALGTVPVLLGQSLSSVWDATVTLGELTVPFRIELST